MASVRSKNIYEHHPNYKKPPLIPLPTGEELISLESVNLKQNALAQVVVRSILKLTGFLSFYQKLKRHLEDYLQHTDMRSRALFFPVVSATLALQNDPQKNDLIQRSIALLKACRSFYIDIKQGRLKQDYWHDQPLEMGQYGNFFSTNVVIEAKRVELFKSTQENQILVLCRNHFYLVDVEDWQAPDFDARLASTLQYILEQSKTKGAPVGLLSAPSAPVQYKIFKILRRSPQNAANLDQLKHTFVTLCLEPDAAPSSLQQGFLWAHSQFANRWWFSSLQLVIYSNGLACAIGNFSAYLDGNVMMRGSAEIQRRAARIGLNMKQQSKESRLPCQKLEWAIPPKLFTIAQNDLARIKDRDQPATFVIEEIGRQFFKARRLSAVPVFVLALQMTMKQLLDKHPAIHQFVSLAHYRYMDLTTIVVSTEPVKRFVEQFLSSTSFDQNLAQQFLQALQSQKEVIKKAREKLALSDILTLFFLNSTRIKRLGAQTLIFPMLRLLRKFHLITMENRQVLISHPAIYPEVPLVGRPGVRLPYVSYLGLHYQIWPEHIVITYMPALRWKIPNETITRHLKENLLKLKQFIEQSHPATSNV